MKASLRVSWVSVTMAAGLLLVLAAGPASAGKAKGLCGDGIIGGTELCDQNNLNGQTCASLGFASGTLTCGPNCTFNTTGCVTQLQACQSGLSTCQGDLASCRTGTCGNGVGEFGEQCDGENLQGHTCQAAGFTYGKTVCTAGCTVDTAGCTNARFVDNGDGTLTDNSTDLVWEKKNEGSSSSRDSQGVGNCLHCVEDSYTWASGMSEWISAINGRTDDPTVVTGFAGHTDWRLPSVVELLSIVDTTVPGCNAAPFLACIDPIFGPTEASSYFPSTSRESRHDQSWAVNFRDGTPNPGVKADANSFFLRAVRSAP